MRLTRLMLALTVLSASLSPVLCPRPAAAQAPAAQSPLPCTGNVNIVRLSDVKPGMMDKFLQAVAAQKAWYANAGLPDRIGVLRILEQDPATKAWSTSQTQAITTHIIPPGSNTRPQHDAAWDAFVALFSDSSTIKTQYFTCMVQ
jgi:hypothetical protein